MRLPLFALLHVGGSAGPGDVWRHWGDPLAISLLLSAAVLYERGLVAMCAGAHARGRAPLALPAWRARCFRAGVLALAVALGSPLDAMATALFSAHMVQHLLLMTVAPPLLVLGLPGAPVLWGLRRDVRRAAARWWLGARPAATVRTVWRVLTRPLVAATAHATATWAWHLPGPYQAALVSAPLHALEHASFVCTAVLVWWAALRPRAPEGRRAGFATGMLLAFATGMQTGALGALLTFARTPWYPAYGDGARLWGIGVLEDQQLAGLVMWVPGGVLYVAAAGLLFAAWLESAPEPRPTGARVGTPLAAAARTAERAPNP